jgi:CYTH domain-containing protein
MNTNKKDNRPHRHARSGPWQWLCDILLIICALCRLKRINLINLGEGIYKFAITGGPCSGKSESMGALHSALRSKYAVLIIPESATIIINRGMRPQNVGWVPFQKMVIRLSIRNERRAMIRAIILRNLGYKVVILSDRGLLDGEAYLKTKDQWHSVLSDMKLDLHTAGNHLYHAAIHLVTAADGAEDVFGRECGKNPARSEHCPMKAKRLDGKTLGAHRYHHHLRRIPNGPDGMKGKIHAILAEVRAVIGDPEPIECEHKMIVDPVSADQIPTEANPHTVHITQDYLLPPKGVIRKENHRLRIERNLHGSGVTYWYTRKWEIDKLGERGESNRIITKRMYRRLLRRKDPAYDTIVKLRTRFMYESQLFELDEVLSPERHAGLWMLEAEVLDIESPVNWPPYIRIIRDATDDKSSNNKALARKPVVTQV